MNITDLCLRRPVFAWMLMCGTILFGLSSLGCSRRKGIGVSQFPDVNNPTVTVSVSWPGASPEDVETGIVNPIEDVLAQVTGVEEITSPSKQNSARITATFSIDRDIDLAVQDVQAKVAQIQRQLPTGVQPPTVSRSPTPTTRRSSRSACPARSRASCSPTSRAIRSQDALATLDGVGQVQMMGYLDRAVRIWVDADKLDRDQHDRHRHHAARCTQAARDVVGRPDDERPEGDRHPRARRGRRPRRRCATS